VYDGYVYVGSLSPDVAQWYGYLETGEWRDLPGWLGPAVAGVLALPVGLAAIEIAGAAEVATTASTVTSAACADGDCTNEGKLALDLGQRTLHTLSADGDPANEFRTLARSGHLLLDSGSKGELRGALRAGVEGLSSGQARGVLNILGKGQMNRVTVRALESGEIQVITQVPGQQGGLAQYSYILDPSGTVIQLVQYAYNAAGELVHVHAKLTP
jgi:hypothetical protein